jgi:diaminopimelate decarboxylase
MTGGPSQFGVPVAQLEAGSPLLRPVGGLRPVGFHLYSATNVVDGPALLAELSANVATIASVMRKTGFAPEMVDIGGGFAAPFTVPGSRSAYRELRAGLTAVFDEELPGWRSGSVEVAVESGRYLVAGAGTLLTTVMDVKVSGDRRHVVCDAGVNALGGMSGLGRLLPPGAQPAGPQAGAEEVVLTGPLCTPLDVLNRRAGLRDPRIGDVLAIPNVGAYGLTASLIAFLGRPMPVEIVLDGANLVGVRRLELTEAEVTTS